MMRHHIVLPFRPTALASLPVWYRYSHKHQGPITLSSDGSSSTSRASAAGEACLHKHQLHTTQRRRMYRHDSQVQQSKRGERVETQGSAQSDDLRRYLCLHGTASGMLHRDSWALAKFSCDQDSCQDAHRTFYIYKVARKYARNASYLSTHQRCRGDLQPGANGIPPIIWQLGLIGGN